MLLDPTVLSHFRNIVHHHLEADVIDLHSVVFIVVVAVHLVRIATNALVLLEIELIVSVLNIIEIACALLSSFSLSADRMSFGNASTSFNRCSNCAPDAIVSGFTQAILRLYSITVLTANVHFKQYSTYKLRHTKY